MNRGPAEMSVGQNQPLYWYASSSDAEVHENAFYPLL